MTLEGYKKYQARVIFFSRAVMVFLLIPEFMDLLTDRITLGHFLVYGVRLIAGIFITRALITVILDFCGVFKRKRP